jgi:CelD/BcsL family acetyltransferase involved in cellulose biosynthesis
LEPALNRISSIRSTLFRDFDQAKDVWQSLEKTSDHYPFQTWAWLDVWHKTIGLAQGWSPAILLLEKEASGAVGLKPHRAVLPLGISGKPPFRRLAWMGEGVSDYHGPLIGQARQNNDAPRGFFTAEELLSEIRGLAIKMGCGIIDLDRNPESFNRLKNPLASAAFTKIHFKAHSLRLPESAERFLKERFGAKERYNMRRAAKRLSELGKLEFLVAEDDKARTYICERMISLKRDRYKAIGAKDNFADHSFQEFYRKATTRGDLNVHVSGLYLNGEAIALHWGIKDESTMYYLMPAFAEGPLRQYSPGLVFLLRFIDYCSSQDLKTLDFTIGDEEYKRKWSTDEMELFKLYEGRGLAGGALAALKTTGDWIRLSPLRRPITRLRSKARKLLTRDNQFPGER